MCVCVRAYVYVPIFLYTAHKKMCRLQVAAYVERFEPDICADIHRESATLLLDLEEEDEEEVCVCVCVHVCMRARVFVCVCVC